MIHSDQLTNDLLRSYLLSFSGMLFGACYGRFCKMSVWRSSLGFGFAACTCFGIKYALNHMIEQDFQNKRSSVPLVVLKVLANIYIAGINIFFLRKLGLIGEKGTVMFMLDGVVGTIITLNLKYN